MSELKKVINAADIDAALAKIEKSISETTITLEKSVDKRAMGGEQKVETGNEVISAPGDDRTSLPKVGAGTRSESKLAGNFAEKYPMDAPHEEGLEGAIKNSAKAPTREKESVNKSVEESAEPGVTEKAVGEDKKEDKEPLHKAADSKDEDSSFEFGKAVDTSDDTSSKKPVEKAATPKEESAASAGASSGAPQLKKSIKLLASAKKHLTKAYEGGSESELNVAESRLIEAKTFLNKAIESGEPVTVTILKSMNKAAKHFGKALESFEMDNMEGHVTAVEKATNYMSKAINAYDFKPAAIAKSVTNEIKFNHKDGKVVAEMTEEQFKQVEKALVGKNMYKSFLDSVPTKEKEVIDATPILKSLINGLKESQDSLRDNLTTNAQKDVDFKKSISEAVTILAKASKQTSEDIAALKDAPKVRKSILTEIKSPLENTEKAPIDISHVADILNKGLAKGICSTATLLKWDVDKDLPAEYHQKYLDLCEKIQRS